jgi:hypothetical protein
VAEADRECPEGNVGITETAVEKENGENQAEDKKEREYASRVWGCVKRGFLDGVGFLEGGRWLGLFLLLEDGGREWDVVLGSRELGRE